MRYVFLLIPFAALLALACSGDGSSPTASPDGTPTEVAPSPTPTSIPHIGLAGHAIAFSHSDTETRGLFLSKADGTELKRIGDKLRYDGGIDVEGNDITIGDQSFIAVAVGPRWSPDGTKIAFTLCPGGPQTEFDVLPTDFNTEVYVMDADSGELTNISNNPAPDLLRCFEQAPSGGLDWSPDGKRLVFWSARNPEGLYIVDADDSGLRYLTKGRLPKWSPTGDRILFEGEGDVSAWEVDLHIIAPDGSERRPLATVPCSRGLHEGSVCSVGREPQWSPDGAFIAFSASQEPSEFFEGTAVFVLNADGTGLTNIINRPDSNYRPVWVNCQLPLPTEGCEITVFNVQPQRLNVREAPGTDQEVIGKLSEGDTACLLGTPALKDGIQWWPLRTAEGSEGWVAAFDPAEPTKPWLTATGRTCQGEQVE